MTLKRFYEVLGELVESEEMKSKVVMGCRIRLFNFFKHGGERMTFCPLTAVCWSETGKYFATGDYFSAAREIGIKSFEARVIAASADRRMGVLRGRYVRRRMAMKRAMNINGGTK